MRARRAGIVGAATGAQPGLGGKQHLTAPFAQRLAEHFLGCAINVGAIEKSRTAFNGRIDQPGSSLVIDALHRTAPAAKIGGAETHDRHIQPRCS